MFMIYMVCITVPGKNKMNRFRERESEIEKESGGETKSRIYLYCIYRAMFIILLSITCMQGPGKNKINRSRERERERERER